LSSSTGRALGRSSREGPAMAGRSLGDSGGEKLGGGSGSGEEELAGGPA
jgi:hypothetical protein